MANKKPKRKGKGKVMATRINVRVPLEIAEFLERVAEACTGGNISKAVLGMIEDHGEQWAREEADRRRAIASDELRIQPPLESGKAGG